MKYLTITINVLNILKYWPVSTPSIQISGDTCITKSILHFVCKQCATWSQIRRTWGQWKNKCTKLSLVSKQKLHISVSDKLHFINLSLVKRILKLILYWKAWNFVLIRVVKGIEYIMCQSSFSSLICHFSYDFVGCTLCFSNIIL